MLGGAGGAGSWSWEVLEGLGGEGSWSWETVCVGGVDRSWELGVGAGRSCAQEGWDFRRLQGSAGSRATGDTSRLYTTHYAMML